MGDIRGRVMDEAAMEVCFHSHTCSLLAWGTWRG
jgi:hypothetical protein